MLARLFLPLMAVPVLAFAQIDPPRAKQYFTEARAACERDAGALWHVSLCGPMLFADPKTRDVAANQADGQNKLTARDGVFVGKLPQSENIANTATEWAGVRWSEVVWQNIPEDAATRTILLMHESFHRIQKQLGIDPSNPSNAHLDTAAGRILIQLEWRALERALQADRAHRNQAIADALTLRAERRRRFPNAAAEENALERNEGLAEYTGMKLSGESLEAWTQASIQALHSAAGRDTFVRSFAYVSGPAYGLLLDESAAGWRNSLAKDADLGRMLAESRSITLPNDLAATAEARARDYDGDSLRAAELAREAARQKRIAEYRTKLVGGPGLKIPFVKMNVQFDPENLQPLEGWGRGLPNLRISDVWGVLTVTNGALIVSNWSSVCVPASDSDVWKLDVKPGWVEGPGARKGDRVIRREN